MSTPTETAVAKPGPGQLVQQYKQDFTDVLPSHIKADTWVRLATGLLRRDRNLAQIAQRNPGSLMQALLECARLGHEPGTKMFYLVPMGGEIEGWESYRGLIDRMYRAGGVTTVKAEVVRDNDHFAYHPGMDKPDHQPDWFGDRGDIKGAYAYAELTGGGTTKVVIIDRAYLAKVRQMSRGSDKPTSPWKKWEEAMVLKTAIKRLEAFVPTSTEYRDKTAQQRAETAAEVKVEQLPTSTPQPDLPPHDERTGEVPADYTPPASQTEPEVVDGHVVEDPPEDPWSDVEVAQPAGKQ